MTLWTRSDTLFTMSTIPEKINLLVYGTLRPGQYNDRRLGGLSAAAESVVPEVIVKGQMFNVRPGRPVYPVVDFTKDGRVVGDLLMGVPADSSVFSGVYRMEIGAGYRLVEIGTVETFGGPAPVHAFQFSVADDAWGVGQFVEDGDWIAFDNSHDWATR